MATLTLARERLVVEHDDEELRKLYSFDDLATAAAKQLGYNGLQVELSHLKHSTQECRSLKRALIDLDIEPFRRKDVVQYQAMMVNGSSPLKAKMIEWATLVTGVLLLLSFLNFFMGMGAALALKHIQDVAVPDWLGMLTFFPIMGVGICFGVLVAQSAKLSTAEWILIPIQEYKRTIPEFALQTAVDLKGKYAGAQFFIEELQLKQQQRTFDPFLVVQDSQGSKYYLEVWNEPGFVQTRQL